MRTKLLRINLSYATFGILVDCSSNVVIDSAPIGKWMINKTLCDIERWVYSKNGVIELLRDNNEQEV